jgi:hypothetical protein
VGVLGGTGAGGVIGANSGLIYGLFSGYFVAGVAGGVYLLNRKRSAADGDACELPRGRPVRIGGSRAPNRARIRRAKN